MAACLYVTVCLSESTCMSCLKCQQRWFCAWEVKELLDYVAQNPDEKKKFFNARNRLVELLISGRVILPEGFTGDPVVQLVRSYVMSCRYVCSVPCTVYH